ncbi:LssY C-terminal domain-containing protein [Mesorhizobium sp. LHD-90]|uniref:LssY C-terminal domain-containing protein n=1 Tax=Mesorhizobium sp. LHD-90 TaxID=3071414 RepID=UPI0027DFDDED|nr:LssY C-terminal domain-containing protein [Mesorhizobium sp. LHD-90]MDQ6436509.1 LssY C-terminal domain-containing protein [Mesorhizobium sp. LHD-90]
MRRKKLKTAISALLAIGVAYGATAYLALPEFWTVHDRHLADRIGNFLTTTPQGIPGDPINVGLVGTKEQVLRAFAAAGWHAADSITLRSSLDIGLSVALDRPYADAPVSTLLYDGRRQDVAFEKPVGDSADRRHHVRFWQTKELDGDGRPLWLGSASFDRGVGFSHDTGQITHHIGPDVDADRDFVIQTLTQAGMIVSVDEAKGIGATTTGRNGGGDTYFTDGMIKIGVLAGES